FLLLFAATYFLMAQANTGNFNVHALTRTDALYFTITVVATVGFGDISATSQVARIAVMAQMIRDLLVLGLLVKVFLNAVELGREQQAPQQDTGPAEGQEPGRPSGPTSTLLRPDRQPSARSSMSGQVTVVVNDALGLTWRRRLEGQSRRVVDRWWSGSGRARLNKAHRLRRITGFGTRNRWIRGSSAAAPSPPAPPTRGRQPR